MAINFVSASDNTGSGTISVTVNEAVAVGDLLVLAICIAAPTSNHSPTIADNVNAGSWNLPGSLHLYAGTPGEIVLGWIRCDTVGTPTITASSVGTDGAIIEYIHYNGFVHNASLVTADITTNSGTGTAIAATGFTNSVANEAILGVISSNNGDPGAFTGGFTLYDQNGAIEAVLGLIQATSGNVVALGATQSSAGWAVILASFQDLAAAPATAPIAWVT
jgi:hypothetical protein